MNNFKVNDFSFSAVITALIAVTVSFAGPAAVIFQAANLSHLTLDQLSSWIWAVSLGSGLSGLYLSLKLKVPIITAWSTPGAAILVNALNIFNYSDAIGAFILCALLIIISGITGAFSWLIKKIPENIISAMLAGILFNFGTQIFSFYKNFPVVITSTVLSYVLAKRIMPRYAIIISLLIGLTVCSLLGINNFSKIEFQLVQPVLTIPTISLGSILGIAIPLFIVTMTSQNAPGYTVLKEAGYQTPISPLITWTGFSSLIFAPFGSHAINLAAITAAICTGTESNIDPNKRYISGVFCGIFYILIGLFGLVVVTIFQSFPKPLIYSIAGLALLGALSTSMAKSFENPNNREAAILTFLLTASNIVIFDIGSAFWGLALGLFTNLILTKKLFKG